MKKLLVIISLFSTFTATAQIGNFTRVRVRDSVTSLTPNTDLKLQGNGTGTVNVLDSLTIGEYTLDGLDGTDGQVLTTDGAGNVIFEDASEVTIGVSEVAFGDASGNIVGSSDLTWDGTTLNVGGSGVPFSSVSDQSIATYFSGGYSINMLASHTSEASSQNAPHLRGNSSSGYEALVIESISDTDTGTTPLTVFTSKIYDGSDTPLSVRPTLAGYNYTTKQWEVAADGTWDYQGNEITNLSEFSVTDSFQTENTIETTGLSGHAQIRLLSDAGQLNINMSGSTEAGSTMGTSNAGNAFILGPNSGTLTIGGGGSGGDISIGTNGTTRLNVSTSGLFDFQGNDLTNVTELQSNGFLSINGVNGIGFEYNGTTKLTVGSTVITSFDEFAIDATTDATSTTTGSLQTDGGLGVVKDAYFGNNVEIDNNLIVNGSISSVNGVHAFTAANPDFFDIIDSADVGNLQIYSASVSNYSHSDYQVVKILTTASGVISVIELANSGSSTLTFVSNSGSLAIQKTGTASPNVMYSITREK